jgi:hypothetical protein
MQLFDRLTKKVISGESILIFGISICRSYIENKKQTNQKQKFNISQIVHNGVVY